MTDPFSEKLQAWQEYTRTPWARIRYAVVGAILEKEAKTLGERIRVLDVGGGDGMDALPLASSGHDVTIVDPSGAWLAEAQRRAAEVGAAITTLCGGLDDLPEGEWDLVLCHFVLRYRDANTGDVANLARRVRAGGRLSVMDVNPAGRVLRTLVHDGPVAARTELDTDRLAVQTFQTEVRKVDPETVAAEAAASGLAVVGRYGNRIANDLLVDDAPKADATYFEDLLALELELSGREPFNRIGFAWQLVFER